ncbi:GNAT family N-acetyltransferase [Paractinoplanes abujensis]|uniref:GNAT family N-acetyltransferase n=1 Tax=Paractinoplanes abujensis TaxID=882441 RepID=UPI001941CA19|nr:GNAT family N-acetyltransferase [Actinoplanes abujensis]
MSAPGTGPAGELLLRPWRSDDLPALLAAHRDPELRQWLSTSPADETEAREWLRLQAAGWADATRFSFAIVTTGADDCQPSGHVVVKAGADETAEVGYWTAARARGQGIATRALEIVSRWALHAQDIVVLRRLDLIHAEGNQASCRVALKCGFPLYDLLPPSPPAYPTSGHRHVRTVPGASTCHTGI